jgi:hypothetical protein
VPAEVYRSPVRENLQRAEYPVVHSKSDSTVRRPAQDTRALRDITRAPDGKPLVCANVLAPEVLGGRCRTRVDLNLRQIGIRRR